MIATKQSVEDYLVDECGWLREKARELILRNEEIIENCKVFGSFAYYAAGEIVKKEFGKSGAVAIPEEYLDPNWSPDPADDIGGCDDGNFD